MNSPMRLALEQAKAAAARGEVPVGAVVVYQGAILAQAGNRTEELKDPTAHAEILALRQAAARWDSPRLPGCDLYVTLEPCTMCAAAISLFRIRRLYFGAFDPKGGGIEQGACVYSHPTCHHSPEIYGGIDESHCADVLKSFFKERRPG